MRLLHDAPHHLAQAGALLVSQPPTPGTEPQSMMLASCGQSTAESIREVLDTRQRLKVSKWNFGDDVIKSCNVGEMSAIGP
jgi:hypothetical protein